MLLSRLKNVVVTTEKCCCHDSSAGKNQKSPKIDFFFFFLAFFQAHFHLRIINAIFFRFLGKIRNGEVGEHLSWGFSL